MLERGSFGDGSQDGGDLICLLQFYPLTLHYLVVFVPLEGSGGRVY